MADAANPLDPAPVVTLSYEDLERFDPEHPNPILLERVESAFGPSGLGILTVVGIPGFPERRAELLPLAAKLPHLPELSDCERPDLHYSYGWSHGKEKLGTSGAPDVAKGSYYADPFREDPSATTSAKNVWPRSIDLRKPFVEMSALVARTGLLLAKVCDAYCRSRSGGAVNLKLHDTLERSTNAKGRLLHYFDMSESDGANENEQLWCGWHNDHGLVPALYLNEKGEAVDAKKINGESTASPYAGAAGSGLYIQSRAGEIVRVELPRGACGFQVGEATQIQSGNLLRATPHAVRMGRTAKGLTRETFALFMQPNPADALAFPESVAPTAGDDSQAPALLGVVPLEQRWKPGQTFGEFHEATLSAFTIKRAGGF